MAGDSEMRAPVRELRFEWSRSSGPGGQRVNKANTRVTLRWNVAASRAIPADVRERFAARYRRRINAEGELVLHSQRFCDQGRNVADCVGKLEDMLRSVAEAPKPRRPTRPTRASKERRLRQKQRDARIKRDRSRPRRDD